MPKKSKGTAKHNALEARLEAALADPAPITPDELEARAKAAEHLQEHGGTFEEHNPMRKRAPRRAPGAPDTREHGHTVPREHGSPVPREAGHTGTRAPGGVQELGTGVGGRTWSKPDGTAMQRQTVHFPAGTLEQAKATAKARRLTLSQFVVLAVEAAMGRKP